MQTIIASAVLLNLLPATTAHISPWSAGMYCKNGLSNTLMYDVGTPSTPLFNETFNDWFFHGACKNYPPPAGEFLNLPAGGTFTVEMAANKAQTTLSWNGTKTSAWPDGYNHPDGYSATNYGSFPPNSAGCIASPNLHTTNQSYAAGSAFAIAYKSDLKSLKLSDLTVFSVLPNTPWKRIANFAVPANMPKCPAGGCLCAWGWIPNHCGQSNMYMVGYRCQVTNVKSTAQAVAPAQVPKWCENNPGACVKGAKQFLAWNQREGNNVVGLPTLQASGQYASPGYNLKMGFSPGAQNDIFVSSAQSVKSATTTAKASSTSTKVTSTKSTSTKATSTKKTSTSTKPTSTTKSTSTFSRSTSSSSSRAPTSTQVTPPKRSLSFAIAKDAV